MNKFKILLLLFGVIILQSIAKSQSFTVPELISLYGMSGKQFRSYVNDKGYIGTSKDTKPFFLYYNNSNNQIASVVYHNEITKENIHAIMWKHNDPFLTSEFKKKLITAGFKYVRTMKIDENSHNIFYSNKEFLLCLTTKIHVSEKEPADYVILLQSTK